MGDEGADTVLIHGEATLSTVNNTTFVCVHRRTRGYYKWNVVRQQYTLHHSFQS